MNRFFEAAQSFQWTTSFSADSCGKRLRALHQPRDAWQNYSLLVIERRANREFVLEKQYRGSTRAEALVTVYES